MEYVEELAAETDNTEQIEALYEELAYLTEHPIALNTATAESLSQLPFLTDEHINGILIYRQRHGAILTLYELRNIETIDIRTIELLLPFVIPGDTPDEHRPLTLTNLVHGRHELRSRYGQCLQSKEGYLKERYLGEPFYHSLQYAYSFNNRLYAGIVAEKDAGEPLRQRGYDFYSAHFFLTDNSPHLRTFALGDFKASFGQGLVINNGFSPARSSLTTQSGRLANGFRRHTSTSETNFLRGAALTLVFERMAYSVFYSSLRADATLSSDSTFSTWKTDGLHRLRTDYDKRHTVPLQTFGGNVRYSSDRLAIGITALTHSTGRLSLQPPILPYNRYYFRGRHNANASIDYVLRLGKARLYGETALSLNGAPATLNAIDLTPTGFINILLLHRYYSPQYHALYASAFSQTSDIRNENGLYTVFTLTPLPHWRFTAALDIFRHPWLRYGVNSPSFGEECLLQADYKPTQLFSATLRYKYREREKNQQLSDEPETLVLPYATHRLRLQLNYGNAVHLAFRTSIDAVRYSEAATAPANGFALAQTLAWRPATIPCQVDLYAVLFRTDNYDSRLSSYEKHILYSFYTSTLYGHGYRFSGLLRWDVLPCLNLSTRLSHTIYTDRKTNGSGLETIPHPFKTDFDLMLRLRL
jgi:hypothetical protein